mgnify:CR=1 FL=1|jgi:hypothetical protein
MALTRSGPLTKDPTQVALGLAQIRVGVSATNIDSADPALKNTDSIGALANTKFVGKTDFWKLESGFPLLEDYTLPIRESAALECAFKELSLANLQLARGIDPSDEYSDTNIALGGLVAPEYVRMEAIYTFPNNLRQMVIIFPRANVVSSMEIDLKAEDAATIPITFESKRGDSGVSGGNAAWDDMPLGTIVFLTGDDMV